jgi:RsiW-degrading membrane proteinase PrsW (M82 family)
VQAISRADDAVTQEAALLEQIARNRLSLWIALGMALVGLAAFVLLFQLLPDVGLGVGAPTLITLGLLLSLVPAGLWLGFFYRLDQLELEPKRLVLAVFVIGALVTAACHQPVLQGLFTVDRWLYETWWTRLLGGILVVGFLEQALVYATVRFSVFDHPEFDERVDGVIYGVAAGLGLATVLNFHYVLKHGGVDLDIGAMRIVINALAFASFAGVQGYFIGQARFETTPLYYLPSGVIVSALLNGLFFFVLDQPLTNSLTLNPWRELLLAAVVAVVTLVMVFWLVTRANEETLRLARRAGTPYPDRTPLPPEGGVG